MLLANVLVYTLGVVGFTGNLFLCFLILTKSPSTLRVYSKLVLFSSLNEIVCIFCFVWSNMRVFVYQQFMVVQFNGFCSSLGEYNCIIVASVAEQCCSITSEIICFCFYYRLRMIQFKYISSRQISSFIIFSILLHCIIGILKIDITVCSRPIFENKHPNSLDWVETHTHAFMYMPSSYTRVVKTISVLFSVLPLLLSLLIRSRVVFVVRIANVSEISRSLHEVLIRALNAQLIILSFFAISATTFTLLDWKLIDDVVIQYAIFPIAMTQVTLSPYANIVLIPPYRKACSSLMRSVSLFFSTPCTSIRVIALSVAVPTREFTADR